MVLETSLTITEIKNDNEGKSISTLELKTKTANDEESLQLQPDALVNVLIPPPPKPPSDGMPLHIPYERPVKIPKWIKINRQTQLPPVLKRVMGSQKINAWMKDIAHELIRTCIENNKFHYRKFRREFRHRVTVEKRERRKKRFEQQKAILSPEFNTGIDLLDEPTTEYEPLSTEYDPENEEPLALEESHSFTDE